MAQAGGVAVRMVEDGGDHQPAPPSCTCHRHHTSSHQHRHAAPGLAQSRWKFCIFTSTNQQFLFESSCADTVLLIFFLSYNYGTYEMFL